MSTAAAVLRAGEPAKKGAKVSAWENLRGLLPYLGRYKGAIALGMFTVVLMGLIGNIVPLATGVITDTLTGSPAPFEKPAATAPEAGAHATAVVGVDWLRRLVPYYAPRSRQTLLIYCLV